MTERKPGLFERKIRQFFINKGIKSELATELLSELEPISPSTEPQGMTREELIEKAKEFEKDYRQNGIVLYERSYDGIIEALADFALSLAPVAVPSKSVTDEEIEKKLDELLVQRGENLSRVRHPLYLEERQLAKSLVKSFLTANKSVTNEEITKAADTKFPTDNENTALGQTFAIKQQYGFEVGARWMRSLLTNFNHPEVLSMVVSTSDSTEMIPKDKEDK